MNEVFEYKTIVTIGDTNALQNMYFLNFFKLQGIVRELWVKDSVKEGLADLANGMLLITRDARCNFKKDLFLYDEVTVKFYFTEINKTNTRLNFEFINSRTDELHAEGNQTIVFANNQHKVIMIPDNWREAIKRYFVETETKELLPQA